MKLNTAFVDRTELLFGKERFDRFMAALDSEPVVSIRYNTSKTSHDCADCIVVFNFPDVLRILKCLHNFFVVHILLQILFYCFDCCCGGAIKR